MKFPYTIGNADNSSALLTDAGGFDIASLERVDPANLPVEHRTALPNAAEWQRLVNLVNAAPELLEAVEFALKWENMPNGHKMPLQLRNALEKARDAAKPA